MTVDYKSLADRIRKLRQGMCLTQERLAELANLSPPYISRVETAAKRPSLSALIRIAAALDTTTDYLLAGSQSSVDHSAYLGDIQDILEDCTITERRIIRDVAAAVKRSLRSTGWAA